MNDNLLSDELRYMATKAENLKKGYGAGRTPIKLSFTEKVYQQLERARILERVENKNGNLVAKKGGNISAFAEFGIEVLLCSLIAHEHVRNAESERISRLVLGLVPKQNLAQFTRNLHSIAYAVEEKIS